MVSLAISTVPCSVSNSEGLDDAAEDSGGEDGSFNDNGNKTAECRWVLVSVACSFLEQEPDVFNFSLEKDRFRFIFLPFFFFLK